MKKTKNTDERFKIVDRKGQVWFRLNDLYYYSNQLKHNGKTVPEGVVYRHIEDIIRIR